MKLWTCKRCDAEYPNGSLCSIIDAKYGTIATRRYILLYYGTAIEPKGKQQYGKSTNNFTVSIFQYLTYFEKANSTAQ